MYNSISIILYKAKNIFKSDNILQIPTVGNYNYIGIKSLDDVSSDYEYMNNDFLDQDFYSFHKFYASLYHKQNSEKDNNRDVADEFFNDNKSPYIFVSMIHFNYHTDKQSEIQYSNYISEIENRLQSTDYIIYDSLDCCDIIIFIKSNQYKDGMAAIKTIDSIPDVKYSYSILSYDNEKILSDNYTDELIDKITICGIIDDYSLFNKWVSKVERTLTSIEVKKYGRLGNEDIIINILNCSAKTFFKLYGTKSELLNSQNNLFYNSLTYVRTHIDVLDDNYSSIKESQINGIKLNYKQRFLNACKNAENNNNIIFDDSIKHAAIQVLNSCDILSKSNFALDIRDCICRSTDLFINKVETYIPKPNISGQDLVHYNKSIKKYTTGIMSIVNGSLQADKMFFQVPGFDAVLYDVPSKLIVFYTAFVNNLADTLQDAELKKPFAFLVCPDLYQYTHISKLFNEENIDDGLLLKVRIPVKSLFNSKRLLCELTHEVAHYVGRESRNRELRAVIEINMLGVEILKYLLNYIDLNDYLGEDDDKLYNDLLEKIVERLTMYVDRVVEEVSKNDTDFLTYYQHQAYYKEVLLNATCSFFNDSNNIDDIFSLITKNLDISIIQLNNFYKFKELADINITNLKTSYKSIIDGLHELLKESYADLIMILVLGLSLEEYVLTFYKPLYNLYGNPLDILSTNNIGERISSVLLCFGKSILDLDFSQYHYNINNVEKHKFDDFIIELSKYDIYRTGEIIRNNDALANTTVQFNADYLSECKTIFNRKYVNNNSYSPSMLFNNLKSNNVLEQINVIRKYTMNFRDKLFMN